MTRLLLALALLAGCGSKRERLIYVDHADPAWADQGEDEEQRQTMSDKDRRKRERDAVVGGSEEARTFARDRERCLEGPLARLRRYVGRDVYLEGARMNYCGILLEVLADAAGDPAYLLFARLWRVGDWDRTGPAAAYAQLLPVEEGLPQWVPWGAVDGFGLAPWPLPHA